MSTSNKAAQPVGPKLDHLVVCLPSPRAYVDVLTSAGFVEGSSRIHPGQGTQNARFFFDNAYIEFLWAVNDTELTSEAVRPLCLAQRMQSSASGASPFGVAFRGELDTPVRWHYQAPFLQGGGSLPMWSSSHSPAEPLLFSTPGSTNSTGEPTAHFADLPTCYTITAVTLYCPCMPTLPKDAQIGDTGLYRIGPVLFQPALRSAARVVLNPSDGRSAGPFSISLSNDLPLDLLGN